ncbi:hypothetical protein PISMIDRAFT_190156 [Pisolithus microcarpus 441]|uniref:Uncharacterized protein n=1 Tax=Pisolithus microcarpus 441 TaxID=765257 RepID=A0A0C9Z7Q3_9AGAM|nr:hypothetical protein BKA83DRAFT_190156 [Pisolithus microcarpus]KIK18422.1 hypothetical protein PISMIDRAFT_190156 [Pisolithus microcarpus 441]
MFHPSSSCRRLHPQKPKSREAKSRAVSYPRSRKTTYHHSSLALRQRSREPKATTGPPACTGRVSTPSTVWFPDASAVSLLPLTTRCGVGLERLQKEESWGLGGVTKVCRQPAGVVNRNKHAPG